MEKYVLLIYAAFLFIMSMIAFFLYRSDKNKAQRQQWRIPEAVLINFGVFGGSIGALLAMRVFRHKTKHWYFWFFNIVGLIWQVALPILYVVCIWDKL